MGDGYSEHRLYPSSDLGISRGGHDSAVREPDWRWRSLLLFAIAVAWVLSQHYLLPTNLASSILGAATMAATGSYLFFTQHRAGQANAARHQLLVQLALGNLALNDAEMVEPTLITLLGSLRQTRNALQSLGGGNLDLDLATRGSDDQLFAAVNGAADEIRRRIGDIVIASGNAQTQTQRIEAISDLLTTGSREQMNASYAIEKRTSSLTALAELGARRAEDDALSAAEMARSAAQVIEAARLSSEKAESIAAVSRNMNSIAQSAKAIAKQTSLLALNAAIEAARAGEHGRSFAVVADEVRKLGDKSNQSAVDISLMLDEAQALAEETRLSSLNSVREIEALVLNLSTLVARASAAQSASRAQLEEIEGILTESRHVFNGALLHAGIAEKIVVCAENMGRAGQAVLASLNQFRSRSFRPQAAVKQDSAAQLHELIEWDVSLSCGIEEIDAQHQEIIKQLNYLFQALNQGMASESGVLVATVARMLDWLDQHFRYEEEWFEKTSYPDKAQHRTYHATVLKDMRALLEQLQHSDARTAYDILRKLRHWLVNHIFDTDQHTCAFLRASPQGKPKWLPSEARGTEARTSIELF